MTLRKIICILLALCFIFALSACGKNDGTSSDVVSFEEVDPNSYVENPLTGENNLIGSRKYKRPIAIMVNNISIAQKVQTGVGKADLVFETEVEGGITRLMAVYSDPSKVSAIGSVRSARVVYADIAGGLGAFYVHHGIDYDYCDPHIEENGIVHGDINPPYAKRQKNGLASEHTLYTSGENLLAFQTKLGYDNDVQINSFATFSATDVALVGGVANFVRVPFNTGYKTDFIYNAETKKYTRARDKAPFTDYSTGETEEFKNVFVLKTTMSYYADNKHRVVDLESGDGYYFSNGQYEEIKWSKGAPTDPFKFTKADGTALTVNAGNSYICIPKSDITVTIE